MRKSFLEMRQLADDEVLSAALKHTQSIDAPPMNPASVNTPPTAGQVNQGPTTQGATPPVNPQPASFDFNALGFKEEDGIKSIDDLKPIIDNGRKFSQVNKQLDEATSTINGLQTRLNEKLNPFASDVHAEFNHFAKETGNHNWSFFNKLRESELEKLSPIEVLVLKQQLTDKNGSLSASDIQSVIESQYNIEKEDFSDIDDDDRRQRLEEKQEKTIKINQSRMVMDANQALNDLQGVKGKIQKVDLQAQIQASQEQRKKDIEVLSSEWEPHVSTVLNGMKSFQISGEDQDGKPVSLGEFEIPVEDFEKLAQDAQNAVLGHMAKPDQDNIKGLREYMNNVALLKYRKQIFTKFKNDIVAEVTKQKDAEYHNPSTDIHPGTPAPNGSNPQAQAMEMDKSAVDAAKMAVSTGKF